MHGPTHPEEARRCMCVWMWVWHMDVKWALPVATSVVDSTFTHPSCNSWAGCQLCALFKLLSASDGIFLVFLYLPGLGEVLGLSVLFTTPVPHMYIFCPLSWQQGCSVLYTKLILRPVTFILWESEYAGKIRCWWFGAPLHLDWDPLRCSLLLEIYGCLSLYYQGFHDWFTYNTWQWDPCQ